MKKLWMVVCLLAATSFMFAQNSEISLENNFKKKDKSERPWRGQIPTLRNELSIGIGYAPFYTSSLGNNYFGSYSLKYTRHIKQLYSAGVSVNYNASNPYSFFTGNQIIYAPGRDHTLEVIGFINLNWLNRKNLSLYSGIGLGYQLQINNRFYYDDDTNSLFRYKNTNLRPAIDFTLIGIRMINKKVSPFLELGLGNKGLIRAGVNFNF